MFHRYSECFSLCVHGCDHTDNEYGSHDYAALCSKNRIALERMTLHERRTGISFERVMVCPQEKCSIEAWKSFAHNDELLGMVNTGCIPRNLPEPSICAADLLLPAQDSFFGLPILKRHYFGDMGAFAMDLFLGKPAVLVAHHDLFRNGCGVAEAFARGVSVLSPAIEWAPLTKVLTEVCLQRNSGSDRIDLQFFAERFLFRHDGNRTVTYCLRKRIDEDRRVLNVLVNDQPVQFRREGNWIRFDIAATQSIEFSVYLELEGVESEPWNAGSWTYGVHVAIRRFLSEFRDRVVARNEWAAGTTRRLRSVIWARLSGSSF